MQSPWYFLSISWLETVIMKHNIQFQYLLKQWVSDFNVHTNHLDTLLRCRIQFSRSGRSLKSFIKHRDFKEMLLATSLATVLSSPFPPHLLFHQPSEINHYLFSLCISFKISSFMFITLYSHRHCLCPDYVSLHKITIMVSFF